jgi:nucleoid-associated protein Lsr2
VAQQAITRFTDDLDGSEASGSVGFVLDGREYEIDLSDQNAARLRDVLAPYVAAARRVRGRRGRSDVASPAGRQRNLAEARGWLRENGYPVKDRGRIPSEWVQHFEARTSQPATVQTTDSTKDRPKRDKQRNGRAVEFQSA